MREVTTKRLVLNNFNIRDLEGFIQLVYDYQRNVYSKYEHKWPTDRNELVDVLRYFMKNDDYLAVRNRETNELLGFVDIVKNEEPESRVFDLGYVFNSNYQNNGYAFEACSGYIKYVSERLGAAEIKTGTAKDNIRSVRLLEKLGFQLVNESIGSMQNDESGNPISFIGCSYCLKL